MLSRIRALIIADEAHAALIVDELKRGRRLVDHERVVDDASLRATLARGSWDIVLSDWTLPGFSALDALALLSDRHRPLPLVVVAGRIGEEAVVDGMRAGARDVVLVENLDRLNATIEREAFAARPPESAFDLSERERVEQELRSATPPGQGVAPVLSALRGSSAAAG